MNVVEVQHLSVDYGTRRGRGRQSVPAPLAVDDVTFALERGRILGIVGESGSGKSSVARCVVGHQRATAGAVLLDGEPVATPRSLRDRRRVQMVFQDPYSSLNPSMTVAQTLAEPLRVHRLRPPQEIDRRVDELMELVGLDRRLRTARPRGLSGGQRQRASIARALALEPEVLVADEPVSALDVSVQAVILNLLGDLREEMAMSILLISHDMAVVSHLCDDVVVMSAGRVVESGPVDSVFTHPEHPYTRELLAAVPDETDNPGTN
jgi:ABC-type glutathione transport system ATPase component